VLIRNNPRYHNRFTLYDPESETEFTDLIEIHTLELPKLPEKADNYLWHWMRFLRAESKEDFDMVAQASPKLKKVVGRLLELSQNKRAQMLFEARVKEQRDIRARERGALEKGEKLKAIEIARNLLDMGMPIEKIVKATKLTREEIQKL
jgi:predicted transposase/invertase (TIGR01784 family)